MALNKIIKGYTKLATDKTGLTKIDSDTLRKLKICLSCSFLDRNTIGVNVCKHCGCPIEVLTRSGSCKNDPVKW